MSKALTRKEKAELQEQITNAKKALASDKANRPKRQLTQKQLENLAKGRTMNPRFHPKKEESIDSASSLDNQSP